MKYIKQQALEDDELSILRERMLAPEELFLLQYLKNANRRASYKLLEAQGYPAFTYEE